MVALRNTMCFRVLLKNCGAAKAATAMLKNEANSEAPKTAVPQMAT